MSLKCKLQCLITHTDLGITDQLGGQAVIHQIPKIKSEIKVGSKSAIYGLKRRPITQLRAKSCIIFTLKLIHP